jgi:hypothetical protein
VAAHATAVAAVADKQQYKDVDKLNIVFKFNSALPVCIKYLSNKLLLLN